MCLIFKLFYSLIILLQVCSSKKNVDTKKSFRLKQIFNVYECQIWNRFDKIEIVFFLTRDRSTLFFKIHLFRSLSFLDRFLFLYYDVDRFF
jgi:putative lipase involved disintegration of autophagic bodies